MRKRLKEIGKPHLKSFRSCKEKGLKVEKFVSISCLEGHITCFMTLQYGRIKIKKKRVF
jgi:hypothetical protein